jgi:hypothetical protein
VCFVCVLSFFSILFSCEMRAVILVLVRAYVRTRMSEASFHQTLNRGVSS